MPVLTLEEINNEFLEKAYQLPILHNPNWWAEIDIDDLPLPERVEFNEKIKENIPQAIQSNKGIYMFFVEPNHPFTPEVKHLMYIGRVREGKTGFNFIRRLDDYQKAIGNRNERRNIQLLTNLWPNHTYVYFYSLNQLTDDEITTIEDTLINKIVPPLNNKFSGRARQAQQLYN